MHANRNKGAIKKVERGMMKANRIRNTFAVLAVVLTTFMITTVFSLGINYMQNMELSSVRTAGSNADVTLNKPTSEQEQQIKSLNYVKTVGTRYMVGTAVQTNSEGRESSITIQYYDETEWEQHFKEAISNINGSYPTQENEIMLSEDALAQLGITNPTLQMEIPLSYYDKDGEQQKTFSLSGWFRSYTGTGMAFVSESYCANAGYTLQDNGTLSLTLNEMPGDFYQIQEDVSLNDNQHFSGSVSMSSSNGSMIAMVILLVLFIVGSGYLLIYNVLYISISKDTRFYGLIKTIGTTQKQIKSLVKKQAFKFACIGIPVGVVLAAAVSFALVPLFLQQGYEQGRSSMDAVVFFHPAIFILSIIFSAVTVWIACNAPAKAAAKISPVEALRFQNFAPKKTKSRNSTNGGKLSVMAFHNVFRDKKRAVLVFLSLFMGTVTILGVNGILGSINGENYVDKYMKYDFRYTDSQFSQFENLEKEIPQFDEHFIEQLSQVNGVANLSTSKITWAEIGFNASEFESFLKMQHEELYHDGKPYEQMISELQEYANAGDYGCYVVTIDDELVEQYNDTHNTPIDIEAFRNGDTLLIEALVEQQERIVFPENEDTLTARLQHQLLKLRNILTAQNEMVTQEKEQIKTLISDISHQIKTPIAAANTFAQLLNDKEVSDKEHTEYINTLQSSLEKLTFLTNSLIKMSRLESGIISLKPEQNSLNDIVLQAVKTIYAKAKSKNIIITFDCEQTFEAILDFNWTAEAITNVLDNAVKYTPNGGVIGLQITEYPSYLRLDISDSGIGIPEDEQPKVFGRFYRGKQSAGIDGVGIGLYLTRDIVNKQNGYIKVASNENGTTFSLFLRKG